MKKNKMMRIASFLLVAVLMSTSAISGTFAKYVTTASASDTARVAKWGIKMDSTGASTFVDTYQSGTPATDTVVGTDGDDVDTIVDDVVAPGTSGSTTYHVTGAPETAYKVSFAASDLQDVYLGIGHYDYDGSASGVTYDVGMSQVVSTEYYPINYKITIESATTDIPAHFVPATASTYETLEAAMAALSGVVLSYDPNEECGLTVTISWEWEFDTDDGAAPTIPVVGHTSNDAYDTILGDLKAGNSDLTATDDGTNGNGDYNLDIAYTLTMTATQID